MRKGPPKQNAGTWKEQIRPGIRDCTDTFVLLPFLMYKAPSMISTCIFCCRAGLRPHTPFLSASLSRSLFPCTYSFTRRRKGALLAVDLLERDHRDGVGPDDVVLPLSCFCVISRGRGHV